MAAAATTGSRHRHSFPLRLQQILSGSRAVSPALRLESETPPKVKAFIDRVINIPLADIAIPLSGFRWEFNKGNFHHWRPLFMHFDTYFKKFISCRKDLLLSDNFTEEDPFPKNTVLQILRVMQSILENCHNKASFNGLEHLGLLLASTDPEVIVATLETLSALVKINPSKVHVSGKLINCGSMNSHLLSLAQGWGSKEEGLGLYSCVVANERNQNEGLSLFPAEIENKCDGTQYRLGSTLHFEYNVGTIEGPEQGNEGKSTACVIHVPDIHQKKEDEMTILRQLIEQFNVPKEHRFSLLTRVRYACAFSSARACRLYSRISLLAFNVLVQSNDSNDELSSFFLNEPEYTNELIRLVRAEDFVPGSIRAAAMFALGALLAAYASCHERARVLSGSSSISSGGNRMVLLGVLQKAILSLGNANDPSSPLYVDALLQFFLLHVLSSSSSGSAVRGSAIVPPLLPLIQDNDSSHIPLVCLGVKTLQKLMEYSSPAVSLFKDLGGVEILTQRLHSDVQRVVGAGDENSSAMLIGDAVRSDEDNLYLQKRLIKTLLKALGSATYSPANSTRSQNAFNNLLPLSLSHIFSNVEKFGGDIYFSAVTLMSEIIHKDPTCFPALKELGLPDAFLSSVCLGVPPSSKALICLPNGLGAICLNNGGLEAVRESSALRFLVDVFTNRNYVIAMNEGVVLLANAVEELLRHVSSLRATGVDIVIEILTKLSSIYVDQSKSVHKTSVESMDMETDIESKETERNDLVSAADSSMDGISHDQFVHLSIFHVLVLIHRLMENSETCRLFVEKGGIDTLLKILLRPSMSQSSEGLPIALHSTMVFKSFTQHHSAPLARALSSSLREFVKKALGELELVNSSCLSTSSSVLNSEALSSVFVVEFLLFLAASKDNRWINALLTEFGDSSRDVLEDIGRVHREVLWQISSIKDTKSDADADSSPLSDEQRLEHPTSELDETRFSSFRQYLDPLLRRRGSGWSIESQMSDIINMYRDFGQAAGGSQRTGIDRSLNLGTSSGAQGQSSSSANASSSGNTDESRKRSDYLSCRDMMKSLSDHINHLIMELGKAMLLSSRRENTIMNLSPSVTAVASAVGSIALEHLNFERCTNQSEKSDPVTTKCRYLGKVIDFIDAIMLDRPESCNSIILNAMYCRGVIHAILTTFEATSELLFTVKRSPASPMETDKAVLEDKEQTDYSWIYGPLTNYGMLMDRLVNSSYILSSSTRQLLEQPVCITNVPFPQDAERFMKLLQSKVLKTVLPIWNNQHFPDCNSEFIAEITSILRHVYSGVNVKNIAGNTSARLAGPPPDENAISLIVEMGFSRARAEEALRHVGTNSVEIATDWLFSHPEEPQEDDELARALAMSLGNSDGSSNESTAVEPSTSVVNELEEEMVQFPSLDEFLVSCIKLLQAKDSLAFSIRNLLVTICSQNDGQNRVKVLSYVIDHVKECSSLSSSKNDTVLSSIFHVLALILHEDIAAREIACNAGHIKASLDLLSGWEMESGENSIVEVPKWVMPCFLSIDQMLQTQPKLPDISELDLTNSANLKAQTSVTIDESKKDDSPLGFLGMDNQKRLVEICCKCIKKHVPSGVMHAVLQLCATLTKIHAVAISFLEYGGFHALLSLPTRSYFPGYNNIASTIVRHILEDPQTLQQAMELEIRHSILAAANRSANSRVTPRSFVQSLTNVIRRDPVVFMKAAHAVCQLEMVGDRPFVALLPVQKDRDKEKSKDKEKDTAADKDKVVGGKVSSGDASLASSAAANSRQSEQSAKNVKQHKKSPQSFVTVIEHLLDLVVVFHPPKVEEQTNVVSTVDMEIDSITSKGKGKELAVLSEDNKIACQEAYASVAKGTFILKLLTDILLTYAPSINVVLRRDAELSSSRAPQIVSGVCSGGLFHHIIHNYLPYASKQKKDKKTEADWRYKLATRANQFLVSSSIRSTEGRKRIFSELSSTFVAFVESSNGCRIPDSSISSYVDLLSDILSARSSTGSSMSAEASLTFVDAGLFQSVTRTLQILDLDHPDSVKVATGMVKALEMVSKEHVLSVDINNKGNTKSTPDDRSLSLVQPGRAEALIDQRETQNAVQASGSFDALEDDMDHDRDLEGSFAREGEDNFMREASEDVPGVENGTSTVEIRFDIPHTAEDDDMADDDDDEDDDDNDDMSADDREGGEEEGEDDEENNDLEEDDHPMSHPDTDQDDPEIDEEFDEDIYDEEDEDEDEEGVILRLEEGFNGINVFDQIEVFSGNNNIGNETLRVMPLDIFGTRRPGRTTSLYNLLGRTGNLETLQHPLLEEPSSARQIAHQAPSGQQENIIDVAFSDRSNESTSRVDAIFRTLRSGRPGHRFNPWLEENRQSGTSGLASAPQGIEDLLISQLRRPPEQLTDQNVSTSTPQDNGETGQLRPEAENREEMQTALGESSDGAALPPSIPEVDGSDGAGVTPDGDSLQVHVPSANDLGTDMQFERSDVIVRDVEAISQASSGSGATLGESLRSLEVEIGSVEGHDDGERHGTSDRLPLGDIQAAARVRRPVNTVHTSSRDISLERVSEIPQIPNEEAHQNETEEAQGLNQNLESDPIDPTFLEALPEDLRAEVLSARQSQVSQPSNERSQNDGDIDPEFLAALPPDIREEVLDQQRAQRLQQSQELEGQPVEMDAVSIIATFPSDIREEVLLTSPDTLLATLTPALVAEANMLRERFAHRYSSSLGLFGMGSRNRRGESSRHGETSTGDVSSRQNTSKPIEADGAPLIDKDAIKSLLRVLRIVQPVYKPLLLKLLLNLSAHPETRTALVNILVDMLMLDLQGLKKPEDEVESPYRLFSCQSNITYSRPQHINGVPPLLSRRVLETLTFLAKNHPKVAKLLLYLELPRPSTSHDHRGKAIVMDDDDSKKDQQVYALSLLLTLLNQPLYMRSVTHLEQLLNLLEVMMVSADNEINQPEKSEASIEKPDGSDNTMQDAPNNANMLGSSASGSNIQEKTCTTVKKNENRLCAVLESLPQAELRMLCSLLAHDSLSENAYNLLAEVLKKIVALAPSFCSLFILELSHSMQNLTSCAMSELQLKEETEKALLRTSSSNGTAILRVLQALSSLVTSLQDKKDIPVLGEKDQNDALLQIAEINGSLEPLWLELSNCISKIESCSDYQQDMVSAMNMAPQNAGAAAPLPAGAQNILPYIESFFVTSEKLRPGQSDHVHEYGASTSSDMEDASTSSAGQKSLASYASFDEKYNVFVKFSEKHRRLLNAYIRQNPSLLEKSFSLMLKIPRLIEFDNKRSYFRSKIKHQHDHHHSPVRVSVRRAYILEDSYNQLRLRSAQDMKGRINVHFQGEEGIDAGGLTREWYQLLSRVIFDRGALLFTTVGNESTFQPNPNSVYQTEHLSYFKFVGRVVGKALFDGQLLDVHFTRSFYKHILGVKVTYHDIEAIDPDYYKNLKWMLENDVSDVLDLTFSMDADEEKLILYEKAEVTDCELIPGGRNIRVTEENKHEYVNRVAEHRLTTAIRPQINAFMEGFNEMIPRELISIFNDKELELLISGLPDIDLDDLKANTEYSGYTIASPIIQWFWEVVYELSKEDKARFLQFVTGTSKVPLEGFSALQGISGPQRFQIHKAYGSVQHLPSAHTCFNQLDLPEYVSKEQLQERLLLAIHEANEGFGFG